MTRWAALRKFHAPDIERMRLLRFQGAGIRKLAVDFQTTQWMAAKLTSGVTGNLTDCEA